MNYKHIGWIHTKIKVYAIVEIDGVKCVLDSYSSTNGELSYYDIDRHIKYKFINDNFIMEKENGKE